MIDVPPLPEVETFAVGIDGWAEKAACDADSVGDGELVTWGGVAASRDSKG